MPGRPAGLSEDDDSDNDDLLYSFRGRTVENGHGNSSASAGGQSAVNGGGTGQSMGVARGVHLLRSVSGWHSADDRLLQAIQRGSADIVCHMLDSKEVAVNCSLRSEWSPLLWACTQSSLQVVQLLLEQGADVNFVKDGTSPLLAVCGSRHHDDATSAAVARLLVSSGGATTTADRHRRTAVALAAQQGKLRCVEFLVAARSGGGGDDECGADIVAWINKQDTAGWTALMQAASQGYGHVVRCLLEAGANVGVANLAGQTAADLADARGFHTIADILSCWTRRGGGDQSRTSDSPSLGIAHRVEEMAVTSAVISAAAETQSNNSVYGELEMALYGLEAAHLIPVFRAHNVDFATFLRLTDSDLDTLGIDKLGDRMRIMDGIREIHTQEWQRSSLPELYYRRHLGCDDVVSLLVNVCEHTRLMRASVGYVHDQMQRRPHLLQLAQDNSDVRMLMKTSDDIVGQLHAFSGEVRRLNAHVRKIKDDVLLRSVRWPRIGGDGSRRLWCGMWGACLLLTVTGVVCYRTGVVGRRW